MKAQKWFLEALRVKTGYDDTHPALGDRLAAMGFQKDGAELTALVESVVKADEITESAAARYLRELPDDFEPSMNRLLREKLVPAWKDCHSGIKQAEKRIAKLDEEAQTRGLTIDEQWERIRAIGETDTSNTAVLPALEALLAESPEHIGANFAVGAILLEQEDAKGIEYLNKIMQAGDEIAGEACDLISGFYLQQGNVELTEKFRKLAEEHHQNAEQFRLQAITFTANDHFAAHDLDEGRTKQMQTQLANVRGLGSAYLVRKLIGGSRPIYVVAVTAEFIWKNGRSEKNLSAVFDGIREEVELPDPLVLVSLDQHTEILPVISRIPGAKIFPA